MISWVRAFVDVNMTGDLRRRNSVRQKGKRHRGIVAGLYFEGVPVDGRTVQPRGCAGFQPAHSEVQVIKPSGKTDTRRITDPSRRNFFLTDMNQAIEKGPGRENHRSSEIVLAIGSDDTGHPIVFANQIFDGAFNDRQIFGAAHFILHRLAVKLAVGLGPGTLNGGSFGTG